MRPLVEAVVADASGPMKATFFNQPWLERKYRPGTRLMLHGKYEARNRFRVQAHAPTSEQAGAAGDVATYPATEGLSSTQIAALVREHRGRLRRRRRAAAGAPARRLGLADRAGRAARGPLRRPGGRPRGGWPSRSCSCSSSPCCAGARSGARPPAPSVLGAPRDLTRALAAPRRCRSARRTTSAAAMAAVDADLAAGRPMQRLLMGEVGSGKTVVALYAMLRAVEHGAQAALMAPTETLAEQHFATLQALMPGALVPAALLTGSTPGGRRADLLGKLGTGELRLLVGTHALIEEPVAFDRLAVAVVDEQHRFGVNQRRALDRKAPRGLAPHVLHMTATPIPRTLALTAYGDLDVTVLRELPAGRRPVSDARRLVRARALARLRAGARGAARTVARPSWCARSWRSPRRSRRARPPPSSSGSRARSCATSASCCCTARCGRARSRRRWPRSPRAAPTCSSPPR